MLLTDTLVPASYLPVTEATVPQMVVADRGVDGGRGVNGSRPAV